MGVKPTTPRPKPRTTSKPPPMTVAIYARKSTEGEDRQVQSLEDQIRALTDLARREGLPKPVVYQEARSAKEPGTRPEFARLMGEIAAGRIEGVLTWSMSRLARNAVDGGLAAHLLQTGRLGYIRTPERTYRPEDNALLMSVENGMAIAYLQDLRRSVTRGMRGKAERGWLPAKGPLGYRNDPESREIVPDEERWDLVRRCWDMALAGHTVGGIHRFAVAAGLTTRSRRSVRGPVSLPRLHKVLRDPFYAGVLTYKGEAMAGRHPAMVTLEEFDAARAALGRPAKPKSPALKFAFAGALRCGACGCAVVGERRVRTYKRSGRTVEYVYYHCSGARGCSKAGLSEEALAARAAPVLLAARVPAPLGGWLRDAAVEAVERSGVDGAADAAALERRVAAEGARLARLTAMRLDGEVDAGEYARARGEIEGRRAEAEAALARARGASEAALRRLDGALRAAEAAHRELEVGSLDAAALGRVMRSGGDHLLTLGTLEIRHDPLIAKIAAFEPLGNGSRRPERGDSVGANVLWWALVEDLLGFPIAGELQA